MKKTWITKAMIALMTLALVAGVFFVAPEEARAVGNMPISGISAINTNINTAIGDKTLGTDLITGADHYVWSIAGGPTGISITSQANTNLATLSGTPTASGSFTATIRVEAQDASNNATDWGEQPITITVNQVASGFAPTGFASLTVGAAASGSFTASAGYPKSGSDLTWSYTGDLPDGLQISSGGVLSGTPTTVETKSITLYATNAAGKSSGESISFTVDKGTQTLSNLTASPNGGVAGSTTVTLSATNDRGSDGGAITWTTTGGAGTLTGNSYDSAVGDTSVTFTATAAATAKYNVSAGKQITVTFTLPSPNLTASAAPSSINASGSNNKSTLTATRDGNGDVTWTKPTNASGTLSATTGLSVTYTADSADIGKTLTFKASVAVAPGNYAAQEKTVSITVKNTDVVTSPDANVRTTLTNIGDKYNTYLATSGGSKLVVKNSNPNVVDAYYDGVLVTASGIVGESGRELKVTLKKTGGEWAYIDVAAYGGTSSRRIAIYSGGGTPIITQQFWSCDDCATDTHLLNRSYPWGTLKIRVANYNTSYPYVTIHRSNVRTYVKAGSYSSHATNLDYTLQLSPDPDNPFDGIAYAYIEAQYNGTTNYTIAHQGAKTITTGTIRVSGYPALPQTGPDYTLAYVLGGLCLITAATAVTLNVRKKKQKKQEI